MTRTPGDAQPPATSYSLDHFENLYLAKDDPWDNATKWSDQRKYAVTLASLPQEHYRNAYEPGCAVGILTRMLAPRCDALLAVDAVPSAVTQAAEYVADLPHVRVATALLPADLPSETFDLIVVGDLLYYLSAADLQATVDGLISCLASGGDLVLMHFRDRENGGSFDGYNAHDVLLERAELTPLVHHEDEWFLVDVLRRA